MRVTKIAVTAASLLTLIFASGANASERNLRFGGRGGLSLGYIYNSRGGLYDIHTVASEFGLAIERPFTSKLNLSTEINFYYRILGAWDVVGDGGGTCRIGDETGICAITGALIEETGLQIPLTIRYTPVERIPFYLSVGWQFGFPLNHRVEEDYTFISDDGGTSEFKLAQSGENRTLFDDGLVAEIGYMITSKMKIGFRYVYNLYPIYDTYNSFGEIRHQTFSLGLTYFP